MNSAKNMKGLGQYGTIGLEMVLSILLGLFIGTKIDERLGTSPWMAVVWFGFGCAAAGRAVYRAWKGMQAEAKKEEAEEGNPAQLFPDDKSKAWEREERKAREEREALAREGAGEEIDDSAGSALEKSEDRAKDPGERAEKTR